MSNGLNFKRPFAEFSGVIILSDTDTVSVSVSSFQSVAKLQFIISNASSRMPQRASLGLDRLASLKSLWTGCLLITIYYLKFTLLMYYVHIIITNYYHYTYVTSS